MARKKGSEKNRCFFVGVGRKAIEEKCKRANGGGAHRTTEVGEVEKSEKNSKKLSKCLHMCKISCIFAAQNKKYKIKI